MVDFLLQSFLGKPVWMWMSFLGLVLALLVLDLGLFHRKTREIGVRESLAMSAFYIVIGLAFGVWVWHAIGAQAGSEYFTGFLVEKTLAVYRSVMPAP